MSARKKPAKKDDKPGVKRETSRVLAARKEGEDKVENWADRPDSLAYEKALKLYPKIVQAYQNQDAQEDKIEEYWAIFNAEPDDNRSYVGNSTCYLPEVRNCIKARTKRTLRQLFPNSGRHVEAVGSDMQKPYPLLALQEHYIRKTRLKNVVRADLIGGDVTGQWCLYVDWISAQRKVRKPVQSPKILEDGDTGVEMAEVAPEEDAEFDLEVETVYEERPDVVPLAVQDLAVIPPTANRLDPDVITSVRLRMSESRVNEMLDEGVFVDNFGLGDDEVFKALETHNNKQLDRHGGKERSHDAGIKTGKTFKHALVFEVHCMLPLGEDEHEKEPCFVYFAGPDPIGIIRNPWWSGKRPVISASTEEITGSFRGKSLVEPVKFLQWNLNDTWNMAMDSATYSLLPIVMTDPTKNPNYNSMVMGLAAIWLADPNSTKFANFPALYKEHLPLCATIAQQIRESMDVNDSMLGRQPQGRKGSQQVAKQNQDEATNITDNADRYEEVMLNPLMELFFELDQQFRTRPLTVVTQGDLGQRAKMMDIPPQQFEERYTFRWVGSDYERGMQKVQQQIAFLNVLRGIPPQQMNGRRLDVTPVLDSMADLLFGSEVAPHVLIDERNLYTVDPEEENMMLHNGFAVEVHPADDDPKHIQAHQRAAVLTQDPTGYYRAHLALHMHQLQQKREAQAGQAQQKGQPGVPGGAGPGVAGTPQPGSQPKGPQTRGPAGAIPQDQMADPSVQARP